MWAARVRPAYLAGEHGAEVVAAGSQHDPVGREVFLLHSQRHIAEGAALPEGVHRVEDGFSMRVGHYVFGGHPASHQAIWRKNRGGPGSWNCKRRQRRHTGHQLPRLGLRPPQAQTPTGTVPAPSGLTAIWPLTLLT